MKEKATDAASVRKIKKEIRTIFMKLA